ncbi:MAG: hypothetical protein ACOZIN_22325 [Myxococcota bacterium]
MKKLTAAVLVMLSWPALVWAHEGPMPAAAPVSAAADSAKAPEVEKGEEAPVAVSAVASKDKDDKEDDSKPFRMSVALDHSVGQGTFVNSDYYAQVGGALVVGPSYSFKVRDYKLSASARASLSWEYSLPDNLNGRRIDYSDIRLGLKAPGLFTEKVTDISLGASFGALIPIHPKTWQASTITTLSANVDLSKKVNKFKFGLSLGMGRGIHGNAQKLVSHSDARDEQGNLLLLCRTDEEFCGTLGTNTAWSLSSNLSASYQANDKLSFSAGFRLGTSFKYAIVSEVDEFTPKAVDSNGNPVATTGMARSDNMIGSLGASYAVNDVFEVSAGMQTEGPPKTMDNKNFRFPWFDFVSGADNLTAYSVAVTASF